MKGNISKKIPPCHKPYRYRLEEIVITITSSGRLSFGRKVSEI
jgi:hypothetical protein